MGGRHTPEGRTKRTQRPERHQVEMHHFALNQLLPHDHRARAVWEFAEAIDLSPLYEKIAAVEGGAGRPAVDPAILMALWMLATIEGVSSARRLAELTTRDLPYMWICGRVRVNYHLLADFRSQNEELFEGVLVNSISALMHQGLIRLERIAQDGMRVRAHAGSSSFRGQRSLHKCQQVAREQVDRLKEESKRDPGAVDRRTQAARARAVACRQRRVEEALRQHAKLQEQKENKAKGSGEKARASTTDPEARTMKMGDGGYRPAYNVQFATESQTRLIVAVDATNQGSDRGEMDPMHARLTAYYGCTPQEYLVDCGFATKQDITDVELRGTRVYAPVHGEKKMRERGSDPYAPKQGDNKVVQAWRARMGTKEAKAIYAKRSSIAEFPNAEARNRGLTQFRVRGLGKVRASSLLYALTHNLLRMIDLDLLRALQPQGT